MEKNTLDFTKYSIPVFEHLFEVLSEIEYWSQTYNASVFLLPDKINSPIMRYQEILDLLVRDTCIEIEKPKPKFLDEEFPALGEREYVYTQDWSKRFTKKVFATEFVPTLAININGFKLKENILEIAKILNLNKNDGIIDSIVFHQEKRIFSHRNMNCKVQERISILPGIIALFKEPHKPLRYGEMTGTKALRYNATSMKIDSVDVEDSINGLNKRLKEKLLLPEDLFIHRGKSAKNKEERLTVIINPKYQKFVKLI